ncbi:hypothetical protein [Halobacterium bonnevillei]|uniref:Uncharacterized protein n=1 Tax=Halobacterium bonnevillei TaxID=2692200 RepID=A0A6B0SJ63_9EURY|nr:hypothetical protein [Halobacterium bonnevillei]MXR21695.1 hypothetical protein [Halobacterium bonnevillei]
MMPFLMFGLNPLGGLVIAIVVPLLVVIFGTYAGVLGALQTFFGEDSWQDVSLPESDDTE